MANKLWSDAGLLQLMVCAELEVEGALCACSVVWFSSDVGC